MDRKPDPIGSLVLETFTLTVLAAWRWRIEIGIVETLGVIYWLAGGHALGISVVVSVVALIAFIPYTRGLFARILRAQHVKRQWTQAVIDSGAADPPPKRSRRKHSLTGPRAVRVRVLPSGDRLTVKIGRGNSVEQLSERREQLAVCLSSRFHPVRDVRITPDRAHANRATALIVRRDPFENAEPIAWPLQNAETFSLWDPIPFGIDEHGEPVELHLPYRSVLIGGQPDSGKSVSLQLLVAAAALDPTAKLWLFDGKGEIELAAWDPCAQILVGSNGKDAIRVLQTIDGHLQEREAEVRRSGRRKVARGDGLPFHLIVLDEAATYTQTADSKEAAEINRLLRRLIEKGRAVGFILVLATQKPHGETIDTNIRDLISVRLALSCNTPQASDTILGQGYASQGFNAARIPLDTPGVGYLRAKGEPRRIRTPFLSDEDLEHISSRAAGNRIQDDALSLLPHTPSTPKAKAAELRTASVKDALLNVLPTVGEGMTRGAIREATGRPDQETAPVLKLLVHDGSVVRDGGGRKGDPFSYRAVRAVVAQDVRTTPKAPGTGADSA